MMSNVSDSVGQVALAGDWHVDARWAVDAIAAARKAGTAVIFQVGDFGWWPRDPLGRKYLREVNAACEQHEVDLSVLGGNHEDWEMWSSEQTTYPAITLLPRAGRMSIGVRTVAWMAGAASVNREYCTEGLDWFPQELPTPLDVSVASEGGMADILLTHEAPLVATNGVALGRVKNPYGLNEEIRTYSLAGAALVQEAADRIQPLLHAHGHWHLPESQIISESEGAREHTVLSLGMNGQRQNVVLLNLKSLSWEPVAVRSV